MKKVKSKVIKIAVGCVSVLLVVTVSVLLSLFVVGKSVSVDEVHFRSKTDSESIRIIVNTTGSAVAFKTPKAEQKGDTVYITAKKVLVSPLYDDGYFDIEVNIATAEKILLGEKIIWTKDETV